MVNKLETCNQQVIQHLKKSRYFTNIPDNLFNQLISVLTHHRYKADQTILLQGQSNEQIHFLLNGRVGIYVDHEYVMSLTRNGDVFGEMSVIANQPVSADVITLSDVETLVLNAAYIRKNLDNLTKLDYFLAQLFSRMLTEKLWMSSRKAKQFEEANRSLIQAHLQLKLALTEQNNTNLDLSNQKKLLEQAKRASDYRAKIVMDSTAESIFGLDLDGICIWANPACARMTGYTQVADLLGRNMHSILHPARWDGTLYPAEGSHIYQVFKEGMGTHVEDEILTRKDGSRFAAEYWVYPIKEQNAIVGAVVSVLDITERKKTEDALKESKRLLEIKTKELEKANLDLKETQSRIIHQEKMASIGQLAAGVAHEINNPVSFVKSNLSSLKQFSESIHAFFMESDVMSKDFKKADSTDNERNSRMKKTKFSLMLASLGDLVNDSLEGVDRVEKIVKNLRTFSHMDKAEQTLSNINKGIESTLHIVWNELKYKAQVNQDLGDIPLVQCCLPELNQVFMNILVNASHAIEQDGTINIKTWHDAHYISIEITDNGSGIPLANIDKIFEPFFTTKEIGKGTGLGLSIAYDIVTKKHSGEIKVTSEVGKGTTFLVKIPTNIQAEFAAGSTPSKERAF